MPAPDLTGLRFDRLLIVGRAQTIKKRAMWHCRCDCGRDVVAMGKSLRRGFKRSCGCLHDERWRAMITRHRSVGTPAYRSWCAMKTRCTNENQSCYRRYGGRGIRVCDRWIASFENFLADMGPAPSDKHTLERIDNDGHYEPGNCKWATKLEQANNTRTSRRVTYAGETHTVSEWERLRGFHPGTFKRRLQRGWSVERALMEPIRTWPSRPPAA